MQPDLDPRARKKQAAVLDALNTALAQNQRTELERKYAVRYHKVCQHPAAVVRRCNPSNIIDLVTQAFVHACEQVRFFERVKLERQIKQLEKKSDTAGSDTTASELARLRDDLQARMAAHNWWSGLQATLDSLHHSRRLHHPGSCAMPDADLPVMQYVLHFPHGEKYVSIVKQADTAEAQALLDAERSRLHGLIAKQLTEAAMLAEPDEGNALRAAWAHAHTVSMPSCHHGVRMCLAGPASTCLKRHGVPICGQNCAIVCRTTKQTAVMLRMTSFCKRATPRRLQPCMNHSMLQPTLKFQLTMMGRHTSRAEEVRF